MEPTFTIEYYGPTEESPGKAVGTSGQLTAEGLRFILPALLSKVDEGHEAGLAVIARYALEETATKPNRGKVQFIYAATVE